MRYLDERDLNEIVTIIRSYRYGGEPAPDYDEESEGIEQTLALFERMQQHYYPTVFRKAAHLLVGLAKGHYFSNGNKRMALISCAQFLYKNDYGPRQRRRQTYEKIIRELYPQSAHVIDAELDRGFSSAHEYGFYLAALAIAASDRDRSELAEATGEFLSQAFQKQ